MKERRSGPLPVALAAGILAALGTSCLRGRANDDARGASKPVRARVVPVVSRTIHRQIESVGSLFPFEEVTVGSEVDRASPS